MLILASSSPRRQQLLARTGLPFTVRTTDAEELHDPALSPADLTEGNARLKAAVVAASYPASTVIGADTLVYLDGEPLGKPLNLEIARETLRRLSGRAHEVCTGIALVTEGGKQSHAFHEISRVWFRALSEETIDLYLALVDVQDKAGAYAIQEHGCLLVERYEGDYANIVGLPVTRLLAELEKESTLLANTAASQRSALSQS